MSKTTNRSGTAQDRMTFQPPHGPSADASGNPTSTERTAFTRVELLVVIAVVFLLCLLLTPGFARTRVNDHTFQCLNNLRVLHNAWQMYAEDNAGRVVMNTGVAEVQSELNTKMYRNWVNNIMSWGASASSADKSITNVNWLMQGPMAAHLRSNVTVFKCPADNYLSSPQRAQGWTARTRSYVMNSFWGPYNANLYDGYWPRGRNTFFPTYRQWIKLAQPSNPANSWLMTEEHPDAINEGYFLNNPDAVSASSWGDIPASFHNGACNVAFADGHIETHLWRGTSTRAPVSYSYVPRPLDELSRADYRWLMDRTAVPYP